jgi:hypothetical protein
MCCIAELYRRNLSGERPKFCLSYILKSEVTISCDHELDGFGQSLATFECGVILTDEVLIDIRPSVS